MTNKIFISSISLLLVSCMQYGQLDILADLPKKLDENSGMITMDGKSVWVIEDSGNADKIYEVDLKGKMLKELKLKDAKNRDWEDLARDSAGNVYVADIGNNGNDRKDLVIYKIPNPSIEKGDKIDAEKIEFSYPEQTEFPPKKSDFKYNAEALFYKDNFLYVVTKDRSRPFKGEALFYKIPAVKGKYKAELIGSFVPCSDPRNCQITAADISADGKKLALLGYGTLWIITDFEGDHFVEGNIQTINLGATTQLEAVCFLDNSTLLLSDEWSGGAGRNLYRFSLKEIIKK